MSYLVDVNVLVALVHGGHVFHTKVLGWYATLGATDRLLTCAITELGFVRVLINLHLVPDVTVALQMLVALKQSGRVPIILDADDLGADVMPAYVRTARQTTDGHLLMLAAKHGARFVTLDAGIPGAMLVA